MRVTNAERQQKYREKMRSLSLAPTTVWVPKERVIEIKSIAARMIHEGTLDLEPSQRQLSFAQFLSDKKGLKVSQDILSSSKKLSEWLNASKKKPDAKNKLT
ncbi:MAG: antitoxin MazE-like protein [Candidatus Nucleicultricaceae bacterium]